MTDDTERFWEGFYTAREAVWSGKPNALLVEEVDGLPPGTALDLGCGEGGDALWLAAQGWRVTAADVSATALARAAGHAKDAGLAAGAITWMRCDLAESFPAGTFDLVSACYLHAPVPLDRARVLRAAAAAVAPGGTLLVVGHAGAPSGAGTGHDHGHGHGHGHGHDFPTPREVLDDLALAAGDWTIERSDTATRPAPAADGTPAPREDSALRLSRRRS
jgi:SAM-dependent methyltransferase